MGKQYADLTTLVFIAIEFQENDVYYIKFITIIDMGARSKSPVGTAFAFSRPKREALTLSNTSLLLEYTSRVFLNSLQE